MNDPRDKKLFDWESGRSLGDDVIPLGNVRSKGLPKLAKALSSDAKTRKAQYTEELKTVGQEPYTKTLKKHRAAARESEDFIIEEESVSGVTGGDEDEAKKLVKQDPSKIRGVSRFGKK